MNRIGILIFSTLVLFHDAALASPKEPSPDDSGQKSESVEIIDNEHRENLESLDISRPVKREQKNVFTKAEKSYYYPYQKAVSPRLGFIIDKDFQTSQVIYYSFGFQYMFDSLSSLHWELGFDGVSNSTGLFHIAEKWIFDNTSSLRPFVKAGITNKLDPNLGMATVLKKENYFLLASGGVEDLLKDPMSVRVDIEFAFGIQYWAFRTLFGYSWAW